MASNDTNAKGMTMKTKRQTKSDMARRIEELEAQNARLVARFKTGRYQHGWKFYRGVPLPGAVERVVQEHLRDLLPDQWDGQKGDCLFQVIEDGIAGRQTVLPEVALYIVEYCYNDQEGTYLCEVWQAIEVE